jgi:hypothetical protein
MKQAQNLYDSQPHIGRETVEEKEYSLPFYSLYSSTMG